MGLKTETNQGNNMKAKWMILAILAVLSIATGAGAQNPALADLSAAQIEALRQAVCLAEPAETVQAVFADLASHRPAPDSRTCCGRACAPTTCPFSA